jgi:hypothetical protein
MGRLCVGLVSSVLVVACGGGGGGDDDVVADASPFPDGFVATTRCAPLPAPTGAVTAVTPGQAGELPQLVYDAAPGTTFVLADGTYSLAQTLQIRAEGVTLRSASGNDLGVLVDGNYGVNELVQVSAPNVTIAEVTLVRAVDHAIHVSPPDGGPDVTGFVLYRAILVDHGEQFVKVNPGAARDAWVDGGRVECSSFRMSDEGRTHVERDPGGCYTGGIDAHSARGWVVRQNQFDDIYCAGDGLAEHAVHFWVGSRDTVVENNRITNCARAIGFGLGENGNGQTREYPDDPYPGVGYVGHYDGVIRNNAVWADIPYFDSGVSLEQARGARVVHNTIASTDAATAFYSSIDARFANSVVELDNNLVRRITTREGGSPTQRTNVETTDVSFFVGGVDNDLHLTEAATVALGAGTPVEDAGIDLDGEVHDATAPDVGADEH